MPLTFRLSRPGMMELVGRGDVAPRRRKEAAMGTFARRNGRPMASAAEGRPSCDLAQARE
jgi:hypothetical protein